MGPKVDRSRARKHDSDRLIHIGNPAAPVKIRAAQRPGVACARRHPYHPACQLQGTVAIIPPKLTEENNALKLSLPPAVVQWDQGISAGRAELPGPAKLFWKAVTCGGYSELWGIIYLALLFWPGGSARPLALQLILGEALGLSILIPLRYLFRRERPTTKRPSVLPIPWERYSFPSSHAIRSQTCAWVLALNLSPWGFVAVPMAFLVAWSRVVLRRHYPSDIAVGSMIGIYCGIAARLIFPALP